MVAPRKSMEFWLLIKQWTILAVGVALASWLNDGIRFDSASSLLLAVFLISGLNVFLKPILVLLGLPFIVMTLGLGVLLINALIFALAGAVVPGFQVLGFWPAFWGALVVSFLNLLVNVLLVKPRISVVKTSVQAPKAKGGAKQYRGRLDDVIDV